jgi:hypothetical protein
MERTRQGSTSRGITHHEPWRAEPVIRFSTRFGRRLRLSLILTSLFIAVALFVWNLHAPFAHVNSHLILVSGDRPVTLGLASASTLAASDFLVPPSRREIVATDYVAEDFSALTALGAKLDQRTALITPPARGDIRELSDLRLLRATLDGMTNSDADVVLLYVATGCGVQNGDPYFRWNVSNELAGEGYNRLAEFLRQLSATEAVAKVLIVDTGTFERNPSSGMIVNEFPYLLERAVHETGDKRLWVLTSNHPLERSHVSRSCGRSVFGWFVAAGLQGEADLNDDQAVDLKELFRYVSVNVSSFVNHATDNLEHQTPMLFWGGGNLHDDLLLPVLLSAGRTRNASTVNPQNKPLTAQPDRESVGAAFRSLPIVPLDPGAMQVTKTDGANRLPIVPTTPVGARSEPAGPKTSPGAPVPNEGRPEAQSTTETSTPSVPKSPPPSKSLASSVEAVHDRQEELNKTAALLAEVWALRDQLDDINCQSIRMSVAAPEDWRLLQERLLFQERLFRAGAIVDARQVAIVVRTMRNGLKSLAQNTPLQFNSDDDVGTVEIIRRIHDRSQKRSFYEIEASTIGFAEQIARYTRRPIPDTWKATIDQLDQQIERGTSGEFVDWVSKLKPELSELAEFRLARQLAAATDISWPAKQLALGVRRKAEKLATADLFPMTGLQQEFAEADRLRIIGERYLLDQVGRQREENGLVALRQSNLLYDRTAINRETVRSARLLADELSYRLPEYVRWHGTTCRGAGGVPRAADIGRLADALLQLVQIVDDPSLDQFPAIHKLDSELRLLRLNIESGLQPSVIRKLNQHPLVPDASVGIEGMLKTSLPSQAVRLALWKTLLDIDAAAASKYDLPEVLATRHPIRAMPIMDWACVRDQLDLEVKIARVCALHFPDPQSRLSKLETSWEDFQAKFSQHLDATHLDGLDEQLWKANDVLSDCLRLFYLHIENQIAVILRSGPNLQDNNLRKQQLGLLRAARRALQVSLVRPPAQGMSASFLLEQAQMFDLLNWQVQRFTQERLFSSSAESAHLTGLIQSYRRRASRLPMQPALAPEVTPKLEWYGPDTVLASVLQEQEIDVRLDWTGLPRTPAWIGLLYDQESVDVRVVSGTVQTLESTTGISVNDLTKPVPPAWELSPGVSRVLKLRVQGRKNGLFPSRIIAIASTGESSVRKDIHVVAPLPATLNLAVRGIPGSWSEIDQHLKLHPFANRQTTYEFGLSNSEDSERQVEVRCLVPRKPVLVSIPEGDIPAVDVAALLTTIGPADSLVHLSQLKVPGETRFVPIPFPKSSPGSTEAPSEATRPNKDSEGTFTGNAINTAVVPNGMLFIVTDKKTQQSTVKKVVISPQRPRRFLRPIVRYNSEQERIEVTIEPIDRDSIPASGIKVSASFAESLAANAARELEGEIRAPQFQANLFAEVDSQAERMVTLYLHVDGYPRAFMFRLPCFGVSGNVPEESGPPGIRITSPQEGTAFRTPIESIAAVIEVDAPDGAFHLADDLIEVGVDRDNDRDLRGEPTLGLNSDRQVRVAELTFDQDGTVSIRANVTDFHVSIPTSGLSDSSSQILARLVVSDRTIWSNSVPVLFDGTPPIVKSVRLKSAGAVTIGPELGVDAIVSDELSSTAKVEFTFDLSNTRKFADGVVPIQGKSDSSGNWTALIPTAELKPGGNALLVRTTDKVGNISPVTVMKFSAVTAKEAEVQKASLTVALTGRVSFGGMPAADIVVSAKSAGDRMIGPVSTDSTGTFNLEGAGPGKWIVTAKAVIRNKTRQNTVEIEVTPPDQPQPVSLQLK